MQRSAIRRAHAFVGFVALAVIVAFFTATVVVELRGDAAAIAAVKRAIAYGLLVLIPAMTATGISGAKLSGRSQARAVVVKKRRMVAVAANGLLVLTPCALALHALASTGALGTAFYLIQGLELVAGPVNIVLIALNARDGLKMSGRLAK